MTSSSSSLAIALAAAFEAEAPEAAAPALAPTLPLGPCTDLGRAVYVKSLPVSRDYLTEAQAQEAIDAANMLGCLADPIETAFLSPLNKKERAAMARTARATLKRLAKVQAAAKLKACPTVVYMNGEAVDIDVAAIPYADLIAEIKAITRRSHGANIRLAAKLNSLMAFDWYDIAPEEVSENSKALKGYKTPYYAMLKECGHTNPSKAFGDVRMYGKNMRAGLAPNGKALADGSALPADKQPSGDGQSTGGANGNEPRSPMVRNSDELSALYKFNHRTKSADPMLVAAQKHIGAALKAIGVDLRLLVAEAEKSK